MMDTCPVELSHKEQMRYNFDEMAHFTEEESDCEWRAELRTASRAKGKGIHERIWQRDRTAGRRGAERDLGAR